MMEQLKYWNKMLRIVGSLVLIGLLGSCTSEYDSYVQREMASGLRQDSLIFDMRMGQTKKDFFATCWDLNSQGIIAQGTGNTTARYYTDLDSAGQRTLDTKNMLFYGIFDEEDVMRGMDMSYSYSAWAPWNEDKSADSLLQHLRLEYEMGYPGNEFIEVNYKVLDAPVLVKIDGNRQILMYVKSNKDVVVKIEDLEYKLGKEWTNK